MNSTHKELMIIALVDSRKALQEYRNQLATLNALAGNFPKSYPKTCIIAELALRESYNLKVDFEPVLKELCS